VARFPPGRRLFGLWVMEGTHFAFVCTSEFDAERAKKEAVAAATKVSGLLVESVNGGVQESFVNEQRIEMEARALAGTVKRFTKHSVQWLTVFHTFDSALKV
jgi:hypothetical protein